MKTIITFILLYGFILYGQTTSSEKKVVAPSTGTLSEIDSAVTVNDIPTVTNATNVLNHDTINDRFTKSNVALTTSSSTQGLADDLSEGAVFDSILFGGFTLKPLGAGLNDSIGIYVGASYQGKLTLE